MKQTLHQLDCGVELIVQHLPNRRAVAMEIRMLAGLVNEPESKLGIAHLVEHTLNKGTENYDGKSLSDAFDEIGAGTGTWCGREATGYTSLCLPEFFERNIELHAEFLRRPTFPKEYCDVSVQLSLQELLSLEDDAQGLADKLMCKQALGAVLGRHTYGERDTLETITRDDMIGFWKDNYNAGRMILSVAGPLEPEKVAAIIQKHFVGFGNSKQTHRNPTELRFTAGTTHHRKETEQVQISMALPGVPVTHEDYATQQVLLGVLSGGMSARLFTEVREKQGLVYWVGAWNDNPRNAGLICAGASTTPDRCKKTFETLNRELNRVGQDVTSEEIERSLTGIVVRADIRRDITRSRCVEQADDVFHYGRAVSWQEKLEKLKAVTVEDIKRYCETYIAGKDVCAVTLGPQTASN